MSQEDKRALKIMEESAIKVNGRHQIALTWKNEKPGLPNNRPMAEMRLRGLKKKLLSDPDLCASYCAKMRASLHLCAD